jgi:hypothetical protein
MTATTQAALAPPNWSSTAIYAAGMTVREDGVLYVANWWTQGSDPAKNDGAIGTGEPWTIVSSGSNSSGTSTVPVPSTPTQLAVTSTTSSTATLTWSASTVTGGGTVTGYAVHENGTQVDTVTGTSSYYDVSSLTASTAYKLTVEAIDATGASPQGTAASASTLANGAVASTSVFSPYIDMSLYGTPSLVSIAEASGVKDFTLAFVQSSGNGTIGWAGIGTIVDDTLPNGSTIQSEVNALQAIGGNVTVSFGGAAGTDPAVAAAAAGASAASLQAEYQSVINRYGVNSLDFDIEGAAETNQASLTLRDAALVGLEKANPGLQISYTLPVLPTGLDSNGLNVIQTAEKDGVGLGVINIMAMDYGSAVDNGGAMGTDAIDGIQATEKQIATVGLGSKIGITPMIGVNDTSSEVFTLSDARQLAGYVASDSDVARVSMWSVARDNGSTAGDNYASATGSGLIQASYEFSSILSGQSAYAISDLLWQHNNGGTFTEWQSTGNGFTPNVYVNSVNSPWQLQGTMDFNADGASDLVWRNTTTGTFTIWDSTGNGFTPNSYVGSVDPSWSMVALADFNGDGKGDLLWQNGNTFTEWQSTGTGFAPNVYIGSVASGWTLAGTGDFTGNGKDDLLWQNGNTFTEWQSTGSGFTPNVFVGSVSAGWSLAGVGDFAGNRKDDLVWFNQSSGTFSVWDSTGNGFTPNSYVGSVAAGWTLADVGNFTGTGMADLLFRNTSTGTLSIWQSTGTGFTPNVEVGNVGVDWTLVSNPTHTHAQSV